MANNLFANVPAAAVAKQTISFASAGFDSSNVYIIFEVGSPLKSWDPTRTINSVTTFTINKGYYIVPKVNMDMEAIVAPPLPTGGGSTPAAPTAGVVDDTANTFNWTNNPLFTAVSDYETTIDGGGTWITAVAKPLVVGNIAKAIGQVGVRVKAVGGNPASAALYNTTAFTVSGGGATYIPFTSASAPNTITQSPTGTWTASGSANGFGSAPSDSLAPSANGHVQMQYLSSANDGAIIGLDDDNTAEDYNTIKYGVYPSASNWRIITAGVISDSGVAYSVNQYIRVARSGGNTVKIETSPDATTWTTIHTFAATTTVELFPKISIVIVGNKASEVKGVGLT